jgi:Fic family protein
MRAEFWNKYRQIDLNPHQKKVINRLLETGPREFEGGLTTRKYAAIAKVSRATAYREISDLIGKEVLRQPEGKGRSVHYELAWPGGKER